MCLLKNMVAAPRPCDLDPSVPLLIARPTDYSFPSGPADCLFPPVSLCTFPCGHFGRNGGGDSQRFPGLVPWKNVSPKNFAGEGWKKEGVSSMIEAKHKWERGERNVFKDCLLYTSPTQNAADILQNRREKRLKGNFPT